MCFAKTNLSNDLSPEMVSLGLALLICLMSWHNIFCTATQKNGLPLIEQLIHLQICEDYFNNPSS